MSKVLFARPEVYAIVGSAMTVHRELGAGFLEAVYHEALEIQFAADEIPFESHKRLDVWYRGQRLRKHYEADFVCFGTIVVELKEQSCLVSGDHAQLLNYLKTTRQKVGLLINFGLLQNSNGNALSSSRPLLSRLLFFSDQHLSYLPFVYIRVASWIPTLYEREVA